ncbi:MAG: sigma-70 family RNA polymerase sigma factor [Saprospiraceae bacterium]|nr:sigma-70 family RNA polymerase sigma factor [Saprospiraceae bacterium]
MFAWILCSGSMVEIKRGPFSWMLPCRPYQDDEKLLAGLEREETHAIQCLLLMAEGTVWKTMKQLGLQKELLNEILHDGMLILLKRIKSQEFDAKRSGPRTYLISVCKNLSLNASRLQQHKLTDQLNEQLHDFTEIDEPDFGMGDRLKLLKNMLEELGAPCRELIELKYICELTDDEQIEGGLTMFKNANTLRVRRSQCMKKLIALSNKYKLSYAQL